MQITRLTLLLLFVVAPLSTHAATTAECSAACAGATQQCIAFGGGPAHCQRYWLRQCRRSGTAACAGVSTTTVTSTTTTTTIPDRECAGTWYLVDPSSAPSVPPLILATFRIGRADPTQDCPPGAQVPFAFCEPGIETLDVSSFVNQGLGYCGVGGSLLVQDDDEGSVDDGQGNSRQCFTGQRLVGWGLHTSWAEGRFEAWNSCVDPPADHTTSADLLPLCRSAADDGHYGTPDGGDPRLRCLPVIWAPMP